MGKTIDERVLEMCFENGQFEQGIRQSTQSLEMLRKGLRMDDAADSLNGIEKAVRGVDFSSMESGISSVADRFSALGIIGDQVLRNVTNGVMNFGRTVFSTVKNAIAGGGLTRALNIEQAQFQLRGLGVAWDDVAGSINTAVKGTRYGLDAAAKAASQLVASGVSVGDNMTTSLRAISGVAAMTNQEYDRTAQIFTTIASNGKVMTQQLRQFSIDGLNVAAALGKELGKTEAEINDMVSKGQIDFATFAAAMDKAFGEHATRANETFTGSLANMKAALGRLGAEFYTPNLVNARDIFNALTPAIDNVHTALMPLINLINEGLTTAAGRLVYKLGELDFTGVGERIRLFAGQLKTSLFGMDDQITEFERIVSGVKATFSIFGKILSGVGTALKNLFTALSPIGSALMHVGAALGDFMVWLNAVLEESDAVTKVFDAISSAIGGIVNVVATAVEAFANLAVGLATIDLSGVDEFGNTVNTKFSPTGAILDTVSKAFGKLGDLIKSTAPYFAKAGEVIGDAFERMGEAIGSGGLTNALKFLNTSLITLTIGNFMDLGKAGNYMATMIKRAIAPVTVNLKTFRSTIQSYNTSLKADVVFKLAAGILALALAMKLLSTIPQEDMARSIVGLGAAIGMLAGAVKIITLSMMDIPFFKITAIGPALISLAAAVGILAIAMKSLSGLNLNELAIGITGLGAAMGILVGGALLLNKVSGKIVFTAGAMVTLAIAMAIMAQAIKSMGSADIETLAKGLVGLGVGMGILVAGAYGLGKASGKIALTAGSMILMATAMVILSDAVKRMGILKPEELAKGLIGIGAAMAILVAGAYGLGKASGKIALTGGAMVLMATSMVILSQAIKQLGALDTASLVRGLIGLGVALTEITVTMHLMPKNLPVLAAGLLLVAADIAILAAALTKLGGMDGSQVGAAMISLGGALAILAVGLRAMAGTTGGAAALLLAAAAIALITPSLVALSLVPLAGIAVALGTLAATLLGFAGIAALVAPITPAMIALGAAFALLGVGATGLGLLLAGIGTALASLVAVSGTSAAAIVTALTAIAATLPAFFTGIGEGIVAMATAIGNGAEAICRALVQVGKAALSALRELIPDLVETAAEIITKFLETIASKTPRIVQAGIDIIMSLLEGIRDNIHDFVTVGADIIINFINGLREKAGELAQAGIDLVIGLIEDMAAAIPANAARLGAAAADLGVAIIDGVIKGLGAFVSRISEHLRAKCAAVIGNVKGFFGINSPSKVFRDEVGKPIVAGLAVGIEKNKDASKAATKMARGVVTSVKDELKIHSPSVVFKEEVGYYIVDGIAEGIEEKDSAEEAAQKKAQNIVNAFKVELDKLDLRSTSAELENKLWEAMNPKASADEKQKHQLEYLNTLMENQKKKVAWAQDEMRNMIDTFGEASEEALEAKNKYMEAQIAYYETVNKIEEMKGTATGTAEDVEVYIQAQRAAMHEAEKMMQELMEMNEKFNFGWSKEEMQKHAAERTGYDEMGLRRAMGLPTTDQVQNAVQDTAQDYDNTVKNEFGEVGESFTDIGDAYAVSIGDAFVDGMKTQTTRMVQSVQEAQKAVQLQSKKSQPVQTYQGSGNKQMSSWSSQDSGIFKTNSSGTKLVVVQPTNAGSTTTALKSNQTAKASENHVNKPTSVTNNYNMTQNNTSPKALNDSTIYRQTKTLFSNLKNTNNAKPANTKGGQVVA